MGYLNYLAEITETQQLYNNQSGSESAYIRLIDLVTTHRNVWRGYWWNSLNNDKFWFQLNYYDNAGLGSLLERTFRGPFFNNHLIPTIPVFNLEIGDVNNLIYNNYLSVMHTPHVYMNKSSKYMEFDKYDLTDYVHSNIRFICRIVTQSHNVSGESGDNNENRSSNNSIIELKRRISNLGFVLNEFVVDHVDYRMNLDTLYPDIVLDGLVFNEGIKEADTFGTDMSVKFLGDLNYQSNDPYYFVRTIIPKKMIKRIVEGQNTERVLIKQNIDKDTVLILDFALYLEIYYTEKLNNCPCMAVLYIDIFPGVFKCDSNLLVEMLNSNVEWSTARISFDVLSSNIGYVH